MGTNSGVNWWLMVLSDDSWCELVVTNDGGW